MHAARILVACLALAAMAAGQGATYLVGTSSSGEQANDGCGSPQISDNGRWVAFYSRATNLTPGAPGTQAIFVKDVVTGAIEHLSVGMGGAPPNDNCYSTGFPSDDGNLVAFACNASNLVPGDTNGQPDAFVRDRVTGTTTRVSVSSTGAQANERSWPYALSPDGRYVVITSLASNLVVGDGNGAFDVFVHDRLTGSTEIVSTSSSGTIGDLESRGGTVSADGRYVVFDSAATNLVPGDTNTARDVFRHDRVTGQTARVSIDAAGGEANGGSTALGVSPGGRYVLLNSIASNLVPNDTNGTSDIFVKDMATGIVSRESVSSAGVQANDGSLNTGSISATGRVVVFASLASNLDPIDANPGSDLFVRDRLLGTTSLVTLDSGGVQGEIPCTSFPSNPCGGQYLGGAISRDGRVVVHDHAGGVLVPGGDQNGTQRDIIANDWTHTVRELAPARIGQTAQLQVTALLDPGLAYLVGLSLGHDPGLPLGQRRVPLNPDWLLDLSLLAGPPLFSGFSGTLDSAGQAVASITVPQEPALIGASFRACFLTLDPFTAGAARGVSNALELVIGP